MNVVILKKYSSGVGGVCTTRKNEEEVYNK